MGYRYLKPHASIATCVRTVLLIEGTADAGPADLPLFTNGSPALFCAAKYNNIAQITLFGQSVPAEKWNIENDNAIIAFFFKPFVLGAVFGISAEDLKEHFVELNQWNAHQAIAVNLQMAQAGTPEQVVEILTDIIAKQATRNKKNCEIIKHATDRIMCCPDTDILATLLDELKLTERTFQRVFKKYVGITPGQYRRICQFYFAFAQLKGGEFEKLTDIAYSHGYFDQSHYIRSFKEFAGTTPNDYLHKGLKKND